METDLKAYKNYKRIVADPRFLDGRLAIRGTRFSVSFLLGTLAQGLTLERIEDTYGARVREAIPEALRAAAEALDVPSPASLSPAQRVAELDVPGLEQLVAQLGFFPTFHDAEVTIISLDQSGVSRNAEGYESVLEEGYGVGGKFKAAVLRIEVETQ